MLNFSEFANKINGTLKKAIVLIIKYIDLFNMLTKVMVMLKMLVISGKN
jgi:hypothetical protein